MAAISTDLAAAGRTLPRTGDRISQTSSYTAGAPTPLMDREFIVRNQIVERYLSGSLPIKGAAEGLRRAQGARTL